MGWMYRSWFNHSPTLTHLFLSCFYHDKDAMSIQVQVFAWTQVLTSLGLNGNITNGFIVTVYSGFIEITKLFSRVAAPVQMKVKNLTSLYFPLIIIALSISYILQ